MPIIGIAGALSALSVSVVGSYNGTLSAYQKRTATVSNP